MRLEQQTIKNLNEKLSRCVLIQGNVSKRRILWIWVCTKRRILTRKRVQSIIKATTRNFHLTWKKEIKSMSRKWTVWLLLDRHWETGLWYWRHLNLPFKVWFHATHEVGRWWKTVENLDYIKPTTTERIKKKSLLFRKFLMCNWKLCIS